MWRHTLAVKGQRQWAAAQAYENTMGAMVGDLNDDGFPDVVIGTGTPSWCLPPSHFFITSEVFLHY